MKRYLFFFVCVHSILSAQIFPYNDELVIISSDTTKHANHWPEYSNNIGDLTINLTDSGEKFVKFGVNSQVWFRSIENNPGTEVNGVIQEQTFDVGLRRMRLTMQTQLSPWYKIFLQLGINNQSFISGGGTGTGAIGMGKKPQIFFMDAYNELTIIPLKNVFTKELNSFHFYVGAGLHAVNGISRLSNLSTSKILMADLPIFNYPNIELSDQFARQLGVFTRGQWNNLDFRFAVNKPFATNLQPQIGQIVENNQNGKLSYNGYVMYQFLENESTASPYLTGYYLGSKNVFNLGLGYYITKDGTMAQPELGVFKRYNNSVFSIDAFLDHKVETAHDIFSMNIYSVFYRYDYGANYLRSIGIMNPGVISSSFNGSFALEGPGNGRNLFGTGSIWYTQTGFTLPHSWSKSFRWQPFAAYTLKNLEGLNQKGNYYDLGINVFLFSQNAKLSYQYSSRPIYESINKTVFDRKGEHIFMFQVNF